MRTISTFTSIANSKLPSSVIVAQFHDQDVADAIDYARNTVSFAAALALLSIDDSDVDAAVDSITL